MNTSRIVPKTISIIKKESPVILGVIGAVGVILTAISVARDTPKAEIKILDKEDEKGAPLTKTETIIAAAPAYIPSIAIGGATVACIIASTALNNRQKMAISSAYILLDQSYKKYKDKVVSIFGEGADREVEREVSKDSIREKTSVKDFNSDETVLFYEKHLGKVFERTMLEVRDAEYLFNKMFATRGQVNLNDLYELLGFEPTEEGYLLGWDMARAESPEECWIDFSHDLIRLDDGLECYEILTEVEPVLDYDIPF